MGDFADKTNFFYILERQNLSCQPDLNGLSLTKILPREIMITRTLEFKHEDKYKALVKLTLPLHLPRKSLLYWVFEGRIFCKISVYRINSYRIVCSGAFWSVATNCSLFHRQNVRLMETGRSVLQRQGYGLNCFLAFANPINSYSWEEFKEAYHF